jgi:hypothetical protein
MWDTTSSVLFGLSRVERARNTSIDSFPRRHPATHDKNRICLSHQFDDASILFALGFFKVQLSPDSPRQNSSNSTDRPLQLSTPFSPLDKSHLSDVRRE